MFQIIEPNGFSRLWIGERHHSGTRASANIPRGVAGGLLSLAVRLLGYDGVACGRLASLIDGGVVRGMAPRPRSAEIVNPRASDGGINRLLLSQRRHRQLLVDLSPVQQGGDGIPEKRQPFLRLSAICGGVGPRQARWLGCQPSPGRPLARGCWRRRLGGPTVR